MSSATIIRLVLLSAMPTLCFAKPIHPYETDAPERAGNRIDQPITRQLERLKIKPALLCSDEVFIRRLFLDTLGTLPTPRKVHDFLADRQPDKRERLIDAVLERPEFADYWSLKWCDVLRIKSEFPINLWPNAVQAYHRWVHDALTHNMPYDQFARVLLTTSGSNFREPPANFYRAVQGHEPSTIAAAVALTFMGTRLDRWPEQKQRDLESFFSRIAFKRTAEWKEEIVFLDPEATTPLKTRLLDGTPVTIAVGQDPRAEFAEWLTQADNPWFARCAANRTWAWLMGRGIVHEADDIRPDNPPINAELLDCLTVELVNSKFDLKHLYRLILNSRTYQQSSLPQSTSPAAEANFALYPVRRLEAEVLIDAINTICGSAENYSSPIPEPFTYIPDEQRTIMLADGSISSPFLEMFGRPPRDTGILSERNNTPTRDQRMYLINSSVIQQKISQSRRVGELVRLSRRRPKEMTEQLYLTILSRRPSRAEQDTIEAYLEDHRSQSRDAVIDLIWALINSKEFLYRH